MKVLLVGNYPNARQQSMERFAEMMRQGLRKAGLEVRQVRPPVWVGRLHPAELGIGKWIGYIDRFLLYPPLLRRQLAWADVVHICDHSNAVYVPHLRGKPHVITCHDMIGIRGALGEIPEAATGISGRLLQRRILKGLRDAQMVISVSHRTHDELRRFVELEEDYLPVIPNAMNYSFRPMGADERSSRLNDLGLAHATPFFLHISGNAWYKNRPGVVKIFSELVKQRGFESHSLVMTGKPWTREIRALVRQLGLRDRVVEKPYASNEDLRAMYSSAEALLFPSLYEGFGWPIVEAQACGCPVVTSNRSPMTEVGGAAAIYIDPEDATEAARVAATELRRRDHWIAAGLANSERFSVRTMIESYIRCYETVLGAQSVRSGQCRQYPR